MSDYIMVFTMGLFGSLHCIGMCGGLIMACSLKFGNGRMSFALFYNIGRVMTYAFIGVLMGLFGKGVLASDLFMIKEVLPLLVGVVMIVVGVEMLGLLPAAIKRSASAILPRKTIDGFITGRLKSGLKSGRNPALFLGALNGLIPCGLVYGAALKASTMGGVLSGAMVMVSLGIGTMLPLLFVGTLTTKKFFAKGRILSRLSAIIIIALGIKTIYFALGIGSAMHTGHM